MLHGNKTDLNLFARFGSRGQCIERSGIPLCPRAGNLIAPQHELAVQCRCRPEAYASLQGPDAEDSESKPSLHLHKPSSNKTQKCLLVLQAKRLVKIGKSYIHVCRVGQCFEGSGLPLCPQTGILLRSYTLLILNASLTLTAQQYVVAVLCSMLMRKT